MLIAAWGEFVVKNKIIVAGLFLALGSQVVIAKDKNLGQSYDWRGWYLGAQFGDLWSQTDLTDKGVISELWWISTCSVKITPQPPSDFTRRISAAAEGSR